jgi:kexin
MNYEFEALNHDDLEEGIPSSQGQAGATGGQRKARDLYDAFGASDDEGIFSDDDDDDDDKKLDYDDEEARGLDEGLKGDGDREKLLGRGNR